jgi:hypothetical protein
MGPKKRKKRKGCKLAFRRKFTSGTLKGLTHDDSIPFTSKASAKKWVSTINRKNKSGDVDYRVVQWECK